MNRKDYFGVASIATLVALLVLSFVLRACDRYNEEKKKAGDYVVYYTVYYPGTQEDKEFNCENCFGIALRSFRGSNSIGYQKLYGGYHEVYSTTAPMSITSIQPMPKK